MVKVKIQYTFRKECFNRPLFNRYYRLINTLLSLFKTFLPTSECSNHGRLASTLYWVVPDVLFFQRNEVYGQHGRQNNACKDIHVLIPRSFEYITLHGKKDFASMSIILRWGDCPVSSRGAHSNRKDPYKMGPQGHNEREKW